MPPLIVCIDGNIGSGKSSIMSYLKLHFANYCGSKSNDCRVWFLKEPVSIWETICDEHGKNIITHFYENNERYSFAFQMMTYVTRLSLLKKTLAQGYDIIFTERSIYTDINVFAKMLYDSKKMSLIEYQIYMKCFDEFSDIVNKIKYVYIRTSPEICDIRVKQRNRQGETIPLEYLKDCHHYHDIWLNNPAKVERGEILVINGNEETNTSLFIENVFYDCITRKIYDLIFTL
jgi:deoxycitidine kinase/deoxyguanosine kinase